MWGRDIHSASFQATVGGDPERHQGSAWGACTKTPCTPRTWSWLLSYRGPGERPSLSESGLPQATAGKVCCSHLGRHSLEGVGATNRKTWWKTAREVSLGCQGALAGPHTGWEPSPPPQPHHTFLSMALTRLVSLSCSGPGQRALCRVDAQSRLSPVDVTALSTQHWLAVGVPSVTSAPVHTSPGT